MKEIIKTVVIILLVAVAVYFALVVGKVTTRMDVLNTQDSLHVIANEDFDHGLYNLNLKFIGRGKHIQQFQRDLKELDFKLDMTSAMFQAKLDSLGLLVSEFRIATETALDNLKNNLESTDEKLRKVRRTTDRLNTDLQNGLMTLRREIGELDKKVKALETPEEKKK